MAIASAQSSEILSNANQLQGKEMQNSCSYFGTAFQLIDDLLDYSTKRATLSKRYR